MDALIVLGVSLLAIFLLAVSIEVGDRKRDMRFNDFSSSIRDLELNQTSISTRTETGLRNLGKEILYLDNSLHNQIKETQKQLDTVTKQLNDITISLLEKEQKVQYNVKISSKPKAKKKPTKKVK